MKENLAERVNNGMKTVFRVLAAVRGDREVLGSMLHTAHRTGMDGFELPRDVKAAGWILSKLGDRQINSKFEKAKEIRQGVMSGKLPPWAGSEGGWVGGPMSMFRPGGGTSSGGKLG